MRRASQAPAKSPFWRCLSVYGLLIAALLGTAGAKAQVRASTRPSADEARSSRARRAARLVRRGHALARGGNQAGALGAFREAVQVDPHAVDAYIGLSGLYRAAGRRSDAYEAIQVGLHRRPRSVLLRLELAILQRSTGDASSALDTLRVIIGNAPHHERSLRLHLELAQELGAWTEALRSARRLLDIARSTTGSEGLEELALRVRALSLLARPLDAACVDDSASESSPLLRSLCET